MKALKSNDEAKNLTWLMIIADAILISMLFITHIHQFW